MNSMEEVILIRARASILRAEARIEGMKAENRQREISGCSPAYTEAAFFEVISEEGIGYNDIIEATRW